MAYNLDVNCGAQLLSTIDSELSLCAIFLHTVPQLGAREKDTAAKHGFAKSAPQKAV